MHLASSGLVPEVRIALRIFVFNKLLEHQYRCIKHQNIPHTQNVQEPQDTTRLQKHTHSQSHTTHNIGIALTTR